jgi:uncharacterized membrane protein YbhN (UPF0104 family)
LVGLLGPALVLHVAFLLGTGVVMYGLIQGGWSTPRADLGQVVFVYAMAWLFGTLVTGAPGGFGVREAVLTFALGPVVGHANASALAILLRFVTTSGDVLTALLGWAVPLEKMVGVGPATNETG